MTSVILKYADSNSIFSLLPNGIKLEISALLFTIASHHSYKNIKLEESFYIYSNNKAHFDKIFKKYGYSFNDFFKCTYSSFKVSGNSSDGYPMKYSFRDDYKFLFNIFSIIQSTDTKIIEDNAEIILLNELSDYTHDNSHFVTSVKSFNKIKKISQQDYLTISKEVVKKVFVENTPHLVIRNRVITEKSFREFTILNTISKKTRNILLNASELDIQNSQISVLMNLFIQMREEEEAKLSLPILWSLFKINGKRKELSQKYRIKEKYFKMLIIATLNGGDYASITRHNKIFLNEDAKIFFALLVQEVFVLNKVAIDNFKQNYSKEYKEIIEEIKPGRNFKGRLIFRIYAFFERKIRNIMFNKVSKCKRIFDSIAQIHDAVITSFRIPLNVIKEIQKEIYYSLNLKLNFSF